MPRDRSEVFILAKAYSENRSISFLISARVHSVQKCGEELQKIAATSLDET